MRAIKNSIVLILGLIFFTLQSFQLPKNIQKKVDKEIKSAFEIELYTLEAIKVSENVNEKLITKITGSNFYKIKQNDSIFGYAFVDKAPSKVAQFDYLVLFDKELIIKKSKVLIYREEYGGEISSNRWLKQFVGKSAIDQLKYGKDIIAISGATISARSMTIAVNNLLKTIEILQNNNTI